MWLDIKGMALQVSYNKNSLFYFWFTYLNSLVVEEFYAIKIKFQEYMLTGGTELFQKKLLIFNFQMLNILILLELLLKLINDHSNLQN